MTSMISNADRPSSPDSALDCDTATDYIAILSEGNLPQDEVGHLAAHVVQCEGCMHLVNAVGEELLGEQIPRRLASPR